MCLRAVLRREALILQCKRFSQMDPLMCSPDYCMGLLGFPQVDLHPVDLLPTPWPQLVMPKVALPVLTPEHALLNGSAPCSA